MKAEKHALDEERLISIKEMSSRSGLSRATIWRLCRSDPTFPQKRRISRGRVGFLDREATAWMTSLPAVTTAD